MPGLGGQTIINKNSRRQFKLFPAVFVFKENGHTLVKVVG